MTDSKIDDLAALLTGQTASRRAYVLWRRFVDDPPASVNDVARELDAGLTTVQSDQTAALNDLVRRRRDGDELTAIPRGTRLHAAVFGDRFAVEAEVTTLVRRRPRRRNRLGDQE